jgi:hypothetical protein
MVPVCHGGHDEPINIGKDLIHCLRMLGRQSWQGATKIAGLNCRQNGKAFDVFQIVRDPINESVTVSAKLIRRHITDVLGTSWIHALVHDHTYSLFKNDTNNQQLLVRLRS